MFRFLFLFRDRCYYLDSLKALYLDGREYWPEKSRWYTLRQAYAYSRMEYECDYADNVL